MATNDLSTPKGRENTPQVTTYIRKRVTFADAGVSGGVPVEWIRQGSIILRTTVIVTTAFNAATTNVLTAGINATNYDNVLTSAQSVAGTPGYKTNLTPTGTAGVPLAVDSQLFVKYTQSGTAATAGEAYIIVELVPNRDR